MHKAVRSLIFVLLSNCLLCSVFAANDAAIQVKWGYKGNIGPERWAELDSHFSLCANGKQQSPISINKKALVKQNGQLEINYTLAPLQIVNDGTTTLMLNHEQTLINDGHSLQVNFPNNTKETVIFDGKKYQLLQFHIHTPSENLFNGETFPMEIHFVHQGPAGEVLVIGVFAKAGIAHDEIQKLLTHLPSEKNKINEFPNDKINPRHLLPNQLDFYSFDGSLTTPPCSEGLHWIVFAEPIELSNAQIAALRRVVGGNNARPIQPLNKRPIHITTET